MMLSILIGIEDIGPIGRFIFLTILSQKQRGHPSRRFKFEGYKEDIDAIKKRGKTINPDSCRLDDLRKFFNKKIWTKKEKEWDKWILHVQRCRNAIHAFKHREIGTFDDFFTDAHKYLLFLRNINDILPYPDENYNPDRLIKSIAGIWEPETDLD